MTLIKKLLDFIYKKYQRINSEIVGFTGALKDKEDNRDFSIPLAGLSLEELPKLASLKEYIREIKGQGKLNSCVAHAHICSSIELQLNMKDPARFMPLSERYNYYYGRIKSKIFPQDEGMYPRDAIKSAKEDGIAPEYLCPYGISINEKPSYIAWSIAQIYGAIIKQYFRVFSALSIKEQLSLGLPIGISVPVYEYWIGNKSGIIRKPKKEDKKIGYHALLVVGYFENYFEVLNSWGSNWGKGGFANLPMDYEMQDMWVVEIE